jgi:hypothetical protein
MSEGVLRLDDNHETNEVEAPKQITEFAIPLDNYPKAISHIAKMPGGSQSHLLRCSDGFYVVKFQDNPQGTRTLVNELICSNLARLLRLPIPDGKIIQVSQQLITAHKLSFEWPNGSVLCRPGLCFGSRHPGNRTLIFTRLPKGKVDEVENLPDLAGVLLFDLWTSNLDAREILFFRKPNESVMRARMIDSGHCFRGSKWGFHHAGRVAPQNNPHYFSWIDGMEVFEPWLSLVEHLDESIVQDAWSAVPPEWYREDLPLLKLLLRRLDARRKGLRDAVRLLCGDATAFPVREGFQAKAYSPL